MIQRPRSTRLASAQLVVGLMVAASAVPKRSKPLYRANRDKDRDDDRIGCEKL